MSGIFFPSQRRNSTSFCVYKITFENLLLGFFFFVSQCLLITTFMPTDLTAEEKKAAEVSLALEHTAC